MDFLSDVGPRILEAASVATAAITEFAVLPAAELGLLLIDPIYWGFGVPRGDGHPVLVLPGLYAGDDYLRFLRLWLWRAGYTPMRSGLSRNPGWSRDLVNKISRLVADHFAGNGQRISVIGHSLGGIIGKSVALRYPDAVRQVITLGSPLAFSPEPLPKTVPITVLYSRDDRIVRYPHALLRHPGTSNIEVRGSHMGLPANAEVYRKLANLLSPSTAEKSARNG
jgi:hypothetical protein